MKINKTILVLSLAIVALILSTLYLWQDREGIKRASDQKIRQFYVGLAESEIGFVNGNDFLLPIDKRFEDEVQSFVNRRESFIEVDLAKMEVTLYEEGTKLKTFPVLSKGRDGSWWETPTGNYKILSKEQNHFSTIGSVWMPWSMQFYGNFFIHGWPYYEDGRPVNAGYSGGCVRLATLDAKEVFDFAERGMPLLLRDEEGVKSFRTPVSKNKDVAPPNVSAKAFLVSDLVTGEPLLEKNAASVLPVASLTKLMTGVVASELIYLGRPISVNEQMLAGALAMFEPEVGESYVAFDLLYPLLMQSSNDAANILAGFTGKDQFVGNMNKKALSLSMRDTIFADTSGEMSGNTSTSLDLDKLLRYTYFKRKFLLEITKGSQDYRFSGRKLDNLQNFNEFVNDKNLVGIKNGKTTAAGETLAGVWEFDSAGGKTPISIIVLGSTNRAKDAEALLKWLKENYEL